jgi:hypothetical protein
MVWICDRGCQTDGKPTRHANHGACPVIKQERAAAKTSNVPQRTTDPSPVAPGEPAAPKPPEPEKSALDRFVEFIRTPASTVASPEVPTKQESYLLEGDDVVRFVQIILSIFEYVMNGFLRWMGAPILPDDLCDVTKSKASSLLVSRNLRHTISQIFISAGVRTKGEAQAIIGEGEGIVAFAHIFAGIAWHLITELPKSPKWKEWFPDRPGVAPTFSLMPATQPGGNAWWDPLGVFTKKAEAPAAPAAAGATA